jgi:hypothetical protein
MAGGLRSHIQTNVQNAQSSSGSSSSSSHPMMSQHSSSQSGGRRKKRRSTSKKSRSRRAGTTCSSGHKGGMGGLGAVIKEALVPFGLFAWQKRTQRRTHNGKKSKMTRRR